MDHENSCLLQLDRFHGALEPLTLLEVEFATVSESREFVPPDFVAREVTRDRAFSNVILAIAGLPGDIGQDTDQKNDEEK